MERISDDTIRRRFSLEGRHASSPEEAFAITQRERDEEAAEERARFLSLALHALSAHACPR